LVLANGAAIRDAAGNDALTAFAGVATNAAYKVDTTAPSLTLDTVTGDDVVNLGDKTAGVVVSGTSDAVGRTVAVQWGDQSLSTTVGSDGRWRISPSSLPADGPPAACSAAPGSIPSSPASA
jgi:hypothetical protein